MTDIALHPPAALDVVLPFQVDTLDVRGRAVRLGPVLGDILAAHNYPAVVTELLAEAITLTALIGTVLNTTGGLMTLQAKGDGPVHLLVADYRVPGEVRGYAGFDPEKLSALGSKPRLEELCGKGYLAITIEQPGTDERYQGIVALEGSNLAEAAQAYFQSSDQLPTTCRLAVRFDSLKNQWIAGGLLLQHLPRGEEGQTRLSLNDHHPNWQHAKVMGHTVGLEELTDPTLPLADLLWRLFHQDGPRVYDTIPLVKGCRCSMERVQGVLRQFSFEQLADMREPDGSFKVNCALCSKDWIFARPQEKDFNKSSPA
jgi:molecular chaperone Hsp33